MPPVVPPCPNGGNAPPSWLRFLSLPPSLEERKPPLSRPRRFRTASLFCCRLASCSSGRLHSSALAIHGSADTRTSMFIVHVQTTRLSDFLSSRRTRTRRQPNRRIHGKPLVRWKPLVWWKSLRDSGPILGRRACNWLVRAVTLVRSRHPWLRGHSNIDVHRPFTNALTLGPRVLAFSPATRATSRFPGESLVLVEIAARFLLFERVGFVLSSSERHRWPERFQAGFALWSSERHRWPERFQAGFALWSSERHRWPERIPVGFSLCSSEHCKWARALPGRFVLWSSGRNKWTPALPGRFAL